jgi:hypothetical protein
MFPMTPWVIRARLKMFRKFLQFLSNDSTLYKSPSVVEFLGGRPVLGTQIHSTIDQGASGVDASDLPSEFLTVMPLKARIITPKDIERNAIRRHEARGVSLHREAVLKLYYGQKL